MKSSLFLGVPAVVTVLNLLFAMFLIRHHQPPPKLEAMEAAPAPLDEGLHPTRHPSWTESPAMAWSQNVPTAAAEPHHRHVSPTKWSLSRSSLAHQQQQRSA
jgi:hypothetical protein